MIQQLPAVGWRARITQRPKGGLAAAAFADQPQRFALVQRQADVVHGFHNAALLAEEAALDRVVFFEILDFDNRVFGIAIHGLPLP